jgi:hypothetical protein
MPKSPNSIVFHPAPASAASLASHARAARVAEPSPSRNALQTLQKLINSALLSANPRTSPLFRERARKPMKFVFDLWYFDDVRTRAEAMLERLTDGTMPCDGAWPPDRGAVFDAG